MSKNLEVEICCGSYYDTLQAWKGGAKRVELNSALHLGGFTTSIGTLRQVIEIGVDRVLTSGLKSTAIAGAETIQYLQKEYGEQIEILAGSGLNAQNVQDLIRKTNVKQIHSSCKGWLPDMTTCSEDVSFSYRAKEKDACREAIVGDYEVVDVVLVRKFINMVTCELTFEIEKEDEKELKICYDNTALPEK